MTTTPSSLDAVTAHALAADEGRVAIVARTDGAVLQPDLAGHDDRALLAAGDLAIAPMSVGTASAAPDPRTLVVIVPAGAGPVAGDAVDVRVETGAGLWSGEGRLDRVEPADAPDHVRMTLHLAGPLAPRARRSQFRFPLPDGVAVSAVLWPMAEPATTRIASDPPFTPRALAPLAMSGRAVEIGGGGIGAVFPAGALHWSSWFDRFMLGVSPPGQPDTAAVQTTVRIVSRRPIEATGEERLGLQFEVARQAGAPQHAFVYVEILKLIEQVQAAAGRAA